MSNATKSANTSPVTAASGSEESPDQEVLEFRANLECRSDLDAIIHEGARRMLHEVDPGFRTIG